MLTMPNARAAALRHLLAPALFATLATASCPAGAMDGDADASGGPSAAEMNASHYYFELGPVVAPDYVGSDDYALYPLVVARWIRRGAYVEFHGSTLSANVIPMSLFRAGPVVHYRRARNDVDDARVRQMREIDGAFEVGGFFGVELRDPDATRRRIGLHIRALQDVSGSHDGYLVKMTLNASTPVGEAWSLHVEAFSHYGSDGFMQAYYGVDTWDAMRSGLSQFSAGSGFRDAGLDVHLGYRISDHWGLGLIGRYMRLVGDAADSPVVADAGSADQFIAAVTITVRY